MTPQDRALQSPPDVRSGSAARLPFPDQGPGSPFYFENQSRKAGFRSIAGVDEAGRGCLAGPVVAAAVILPPGLVVDGVDDSKKLSRRRREDAAVQIRESALAIGIGQCSPREIDHLNILRASLEAMRRAAEALDPAPDFLLVDGNQRVAGAPCDQQFVIRGDSRSHSIAAASIIAKTFRDDIMRRLDASAPEYAWASNKGYPTVAHYNALRRFGPTEHHRRSFRLS